MKKIVIVMNCIGNLIKLFLLKNNNIKNQYDIYYIYNVNYLCENSNFHEEDEKHLKEADILILQYIRDGVYDYDKYKRGIINHEYIINNLNKNAINILIPHYTYNACYILDEKICGDIENMDCNLTLKQVYTNIHNILKIYLDEKNMDITYSILNHKNKDNLHLQNLDNHSTLKMYDFINETAKSIPLFQSRHHCKTHFIQIMVKKICEILNINCGDEYDIFENEDIHATDEHVVFERVSKILNLEYNTENQIIEKYKCLEFYFMLKSKFLNKIYDSC